MHLNTDKRITGNLPETNTKKGQRTNWPGHRCIRGRLSEAETEALLSDYREGTVLVRQIAERYSVSPGTVSQTAKRADFRIRGRGRRELLEPTVLHKKILSMAWISTYDIVAANFSTSKQNIGRIVNRWRAWCEKMWGRRKRGAGVNGTSET